MLKSEVAERSRIYRRPCHLEPGETIKLAAEKVLTGVRSWFEFKSVVDFGCSVGVWLDVARRLGATKTLGIDGPWISQSDLVNQQIDLLSVDLESRVLLDETFDMAISLEVAEHLSAVRARSFVEDICKAATVVLFGAAIPLQGGNLHVNEQFPSYWARLFSERSYRYIDVIRPTIWADDTLPFWYRQNIILYAHESKYQKLSAAAATVRVATNEGCLDLVHPFLYLQKADPSDDPGQKARRSKDSGVRKSLRLATKIPLAAWHAVTRRGRS
jgi:hypothetical protein